MTPLNTGDVMENMRLHRLRCLGKSLLLLAPLIPYINEDDVGFLKWLIPRYDQDREKLILADIEWEQISTICKTWGIGQ